MSDVDWIQTEFFGSYPFGYYKLRFLSDGTVKYVCDGEDLKYTLQNGHCWLASKRVFKNLEKVILTRSWEQEPDPQLDVSMVCDGWTDTLTWSIEGVTEVQSFVIGEGPSSLLKVMDRIRRLAKDEEQQSQYVRVYKEVELNKRVPFGDIQLERLKE